MNLPATQSPPSEQTEKELVSLDEGGGPDWLRSAVAEVLAKRPAKLPDWLRPEDLPPLTVNGHRLNEEQLRAVLDALRKSTLDKPHTLVEALKQHLDRT